LVAAVLVGNRFCSPAAAIAVVLCSTVLENLQSDDSRRNELEQHSNKVAGGLSFFPQTVILLGV
jgi:hypothetical protein